MTTRRLTIAGVVVGGAAVAAARFWPRRGAVPGGVGQPLLRMPFARGTVVVCSQGNQLRGGHTHALPQNRFAVDFAQPALDVVEVIAAAAGTVAYALADVDPESVDAGLGYGNQVKIAHAGGYHTFYAHLDGVAVRAGERVEQGRRIGTMGATGRAGIRHLHFSLHEASSSAPGATTNEAIEELVAMDLQGPREFRRARGDELLGDPDAFWLGRLYASENSPSEAPLLGAPSGALGAIVDAGERALREVLARRERLAASARERSSLTVDSLAGALSAELAADPDHPVALYLWATSVDVPRERWQQAEATLLRALASNAIPRRKEPWLAARAYLHLGSIARRRGLASSARGYFEAALRQSISADVAAEARRELAR